MKANSISSSGTSLVMIALGLLATLLIFAVLSGRKIPLVPSERASLLALVTIGMLLCSRGGIGRVAAGGAWLHPFSILGYLLGGVIILIGFAALFGKNIPPLTSYHQSFVAVTAIAVVKLVITTIHQLFL
jgi:hypothetical protein